MPKQVDHDLRREDLAKAAYKVIAKRGLAAATMRDVSTASGWSSGAIVHYLPSKDEILLAAAGYSLKRVQARVDAVRGKAKGLAALRLANLDMLPFDDEMTGFRRIWLSLWERAEHNPAISRFMSERYDYSRQASSALIREAQEMGEIPLEVNAEDAAGVLVAVGDGISIQILVCGDAVPAEQHVTSLERCIQQMLRH